MKTKNKALLLSLCAVLLVAASVLGTMAYLTSQDAVVNTFSVGSISMSLDEQDVDNSTPGENDRDKANTYHLLPGHTYVKDPIIHIGATSEDAWVFVKVENGIAAYEAATVKGGYTNIADQITVTNGWTPLSGVEGVYYKEYTKNQNDKDLEVFAEFKVADNANDVEGWTNITADTHKINVTGYAVQKDGFSTAAEAWNTTFGANTQG